MPQKIIRIGTRESQLAVRQATLVQDLLHKIRVSTELVYIKSEGDIDTVTPLYELGVQGVFTKALDAALLNNRIDIAVHSMKDVPTMLAKGIVEAAVLQRASYKDIFVFKKDEDLQKLGFQNGQWLNDHELFKNSSFTIGTGSIRRVAQWLNRYPKHTAENLRGNVDTRLRKVDESDWNGAIFAAAGLERINLRPQKSIDLDWMLPAPAQGAIMIVCRDNDTYAYENCHSLNHPVTALCAKFERDFLRTLMGGCSTPISALATMQNAQIVFKGNICAPDGMQKSEIEEVVNISEAKNLGVSAANEILLQPSALKIVQDIRNAKN